MVIKRQYKGMVETFSELGGMVDMLFMLFFFPYSIYNHRALKEGLVEAIHGVKKPAKSRLQPSRGAKSAQDQSSSPGDTDAAAAKRYSSLLEQIESSLDVVQITKELIKTARILESLEPPGKPEAGIREESDLSPDHRLVDGIGVPANDASHCPPLNTVPWSKAGSQHPHTMPKKSHVFQKKSIINHNRASIGNILEPIRGSPFKTDLELKVKPPRRSSALGRHSSPKPRKGTASKEAGNSHLPFEDLDQRH